MIAIVKYNAGNITSVKIAVERLGYPCLITDEPEKIAAASKVIFPGVGEAKSAMNYLKFKGLDKLIVKLSQPVLGICLGQQLLCQHSTEGDTPCLGVFDVLVKKFPATNKIPHIGWNTILHNQSPLFNGIKQNEDLYFVHSYFCELSNFTTAVCEYNFKFSAAMNKNNFYATQFHLEKSAYIGQQILKNFLSL